MLIIITEIVHLRIEAGSGEGDEEKKPSKERRLRKYGENGASESVQFQQEG